MSVLSEKYELVVGLEVHAQLLTETKLFSGDSSAFGAAPNTHISPITLGHPGTLPRLNKVAVEYAIKIGLACDCSITRYNYFARKILLLPRSAKRLSDFTTYNPHLCRGFVEVKSGDAKRQIH